jgi:UDP:flavonoid glycosyltransferase YjiC (YdhE family)
VPAPRPRILVTTAAALGHFHPLAAIATALRDQGAEIRFATSPGFCPQVASAGFDAVPCGMDWRSRDLAETWPDFQLVPAAERNAWVNSEMWAKRLPEAMIPDLLRAVEDWRPSLVLSGRAELAGSVVGEATGVPYATMSAGRVIGLREFIDATRRGRAELRRGLGLAPDAAGDALYRHLYLNHIPASFLPDEIPVPARRDFRPAVFTERTSEAPRWLRKVEPRSAIYVTLGSILGEVWPDAFVRVLEAVEPLGRPVVVTVGHGGDVRPLADRFPGVHVGNYIPQRLVLGRAALLVCHGGINTLLGGLSEGVPVLVLPTEQSDQIWNARRCRELGVGLSGDIGQADVPAIRDLAAAVLSDGSYQRAVAAWRAHMLRLPPVEDAVELLLRLANEGSDHPDAPR